ncbi:MAG: hypothetical protein U0Q11_24505 [Vicinamibacterales bacterium]
MFSFLGSAQPSDFVTIGLLVALEGLLSADNAMVLAILVLGLPPDQRQKALRYGILGAFAFRSLATLLAVYLISLSWVKLVGAAYLMYLSVQHFTQDGGAEERRTPPQAKAMLGLSAFWATVLKVELTDIVFAVDSILVAVAMSSKTWVILAGGILGIIAMRLVIGKLLARGRGTLPAARRRRVCHHRVGVDQAGRRIPAHRRPRPLRNSQVRLSLGLIAFIFAAALDLRLSPRGARRI